MKVIYLFVLMTLLPLTLYADWFITGPIDVCPNTEHIYRLTMGCFNCQSKKWTIRVEGGVIVKSLDNGIQTHCAPDRDITKYNTETHSPPVTTLEYDNQTMKSGYIIRWGTAGVPGKITITGSASVSCCPAWDNPTTCPITTKEYNITVQKPTLTVPVAICANETKAFSLDESCNSTSYDWIAPTGWSIQGGGNTLLNSPLRTVNIKAPSTGSGFFDIKAKNNLLSTYITQRVWLGPVTSTTILSSPADAVSGKICANRTTQFGARVDGGTSFQWTVTGGTIVEGQGTAVLTVLTPSPGKVITVQAKGGNHCGNGTGSGASRTFNTATSINGIPCYAERISYDTSLNSNEDSLHTASMEVYPNPGSHLLHIKLGDLNTISKDTDFRISLFDSKGKMKGQTTVKQDKLQITVSGLPSGIYHLSVSYANKIISKQIVIQH